MKIFILLLMSCLPMVGVDQMPVLNIQTAMTSADQASFGRITPYQIESVGNVLVNPASLGGISFTQLGISTFQLSGEMDYRHFSIAIPYNGWVYGVSAGSNVSSGFIETQKEDIGSGNVVIRDIGQFSSGFDLLHFSMGKQSNRSLFFIDHFNYGLGLSLLTQVIGSSRRSPSYGLDLGMIATSFFDGALVDRLDIGVSVVNAVSTELPKWNLNNKGESQSQQMERQFFIGSRFDILNYSSAIHFGAYGQGTGIRDVMFGADVDVAHGLELRFSTVYDFFQSHDFQYNFGAGLTLKRVAGFGTSIYDMTVDYNYTLYPFPRVSDPSHVVSFSFLGQSTDRRPIVLSPSVSYQTDRNRVDFHGTSDRNSTVYIYNDESLVGQVLADNNGKWEVNNLVVDSGYNSITFRSKSGTNDMSGPSIPVVIQYDNDPPTFSTEIDIMSDQVVIRLSSSESLSRATLESDDGTILFRKISDRLYTALVPLPDDMQSGQPLPEKMMSFDIRAIDAIGNEAPTQSVSFFVEALFPADQSVVYNDAITVLGYASPYVESIEVNGSMVQPDKNNGFSNSVQLDYGKQLVVIRVKTENGEQLNYYARLLCMKRFSDIPKFAKYRRDIEFLATLGYVNGKDDGLFHPEEKMTRRDVTLAIAKQKNIEPKPLDYDPFLDIPKSDPDAGIISAAVDAGITYAFADGTFKPDDTVSIADAFKMLNNSGVIDSEDIVVSKDPIKRYEFALFFKQVRRYDQRVIYLMDWDQGYQLPD